MPQILELCNYAPPVSSGVTRRLNTGLGRSSAYLQGPHQLASVIEASTSIRPIADDSLTLMLTTHWRFDFISTALEDWQNPAPLSEEGTGRWTP